MKTAFNKVNTTFGNLSFDLQVDQGGKKATLTIDLEPFQGQKPDKIIVHQTAFGKGKDKITIDWEENIKIDLQIE
jgi:hypothetical protein